MIIINTIINPKLNAQNMICYFRGFLLRSMHESTNFCRLIFSNGALPNISNINHLTNNTSTQGIWGNVLRTYHEDDITSMCHLHCWTDTGGGLSGRFGHLQWTWWYTEADFDWATRVTRVNPTWYPVYNYLHCACSTTRVIQLNTNDRDHGHKPVNKM